MRGNGMGVYFGESRERELSGDKDKEAYGKCGETDTRPNK